MLDGKSCHYLLVFVCGHVPREEVIRVLQAVEAAMRALEVLDGRECFGVLRGALQVVPLLRLLERVVVGFLVPGVCSGLMQSLGESAMPCKHLVTGLAMNNNAGGDALEMQ
jgi:hypothetical protein